MSAYLHYCGASPVCIDLLKIRADTALPQVHVHVEMYDGVYLCLGFCWFVTFTQQVMCNGVLYEKWVPQGSNLTPMLLLLFIN